MRVFVASGDPTSEETIARAALRAPIERTPRAEDADVVLVADGTLDEPSLAALRAQLPGAIFVVHTMALAPDRWHALERLGADRVINSGALARELRRLAASPSAERLVYLASAAEVAGRLGLLAHLVIGGAELLLVKGDGPPVCLEGPCPHAGGSLAGATCEDGVLTCPLHGSQFRIADGVRVRGPSDLGLRTLPVLLVEGRYAVRARSG
jgi:nitrite reductase/ring-hydroxylating ferredoxin subunit